jgi:hypothetical protein
VALGAAVLAIGGSVYAFAPFQLKDPVAGTVVSVADLKANNQALRDKVTELQNAIQKPVYTNAGTGKSYSLHATYCNLTAPTTGQVNDGGLAGIPATKSLCEKACGNSASAHMCTTPELQRHLATGGTVPGSQAWYAAGTWTYDGAHVVVDCVAWTSASATNMGPVVYPTDSSHDDYCNQSHPIACCD